MTASDTNYTRMLAQSVLSVCDEADQLRKALYEANKTIDALMDEIKRLKPTVDYEGVPTV